MKALIFRNQRRAHFNASTAGHFIEMADDAARGVKGLLDRVSQRRRFGRHAASGRDGSSRTLRVRRLRRDGLRRRGLRRGIGWQRCGCGSGVFVGSGVAVGVRRVRRRDVGVLVGSGVAVGGTGVEVGGGRVGTIVGAGGGVDVLHPANNAIKIISIRQRRSTANMILLAKLFFPAVSRLPLCLRFKNLQSSCAAKCAYFTIPAPPATPH